MARPKKVIDEDQLFKLAAINCSLAEMAAVLNCDVKTLTNRFSHVIEKGRENGKMSLKRKQYEVAMGGNVSMLIWLGKNILGQRDTFPEENPSSPTTPSVYKLHVADKPDTKAG